MTTESDGGVWRSSVWMAAGVLVCSFGAGVVGAQEPTAARTAAAGEGGGLAEIVVTAQKREERLQDVPITVSAFTPESLTNNRIATTQDLQFLAPALLYNQLGGYAQPFLRGIGSDISSPDSDATVGTYIDGAFVADSQSTIESLLGVERVEVLEGPQGTLFGRNTLAGAVSITTLTPKHQFEAAGSVTLGNYADKEVTARISGGVTDNLAVGLYAALTRSNTIYDRQFIAGEPQHNDGRGVRLKAVYDPLPGMKLTGSVEYTTNDSPDVSGFRQGQVNSYGFGLFGAPVLIAPWTIQNDYAFRNSNRSFNTTLREEFDLGGDFQVVGISNYRNNRIFTSNDLDATSADVLGSYALQFNRTYSQELQLVSPKTDRFEYIAGLYFFHQNGGEVPTVSQSPFAFLPATTSFTTAAVVTNSYAGFGQLTFKATDDLRLTLGGRYSHEFKRIYNGSFGLSTSPATVDPHCCLIAPVTLIPDQSKTWGQFTPKVGVDYRMGGTLLYATYSEGFQSGVFNVTAPRDAPVNPEKLKAFEIGAKSDLLNNRLRANVAAYYYDFKDIQVQIDISGNNNQGAETVFLNAAAAKAYGLETSLEMAVAPELTVSGQASWQHSKYTRFDGFPAQIANTPPALGYATVPVDVAGNQLERAPKWTASLSEDYHRSLMGGEVKENFGVYYNGGFQWDPSGLHPQKAYALLNGSLGYEFPGHQWTLSAWAKNIANKYYADMYFPIVFGVLTSDGMPRTFGATVAFKY
jgi:iron complex outermembrane recepter protein